MEASASQKHTTSLDTAWSPAQHAAPKPRRGSCNPRPVAPGDGRRVGQREATLPIACVEGWSQSARWRGVPVRELLAAAGARPGARVDVRSLQSGGLYRSSTVDPGQADDPDTLIALRLDGEEAALDHGYPARLIGPNRPGVMQTKWVSTLVVP